MSSPPGRILLVEDDANVLELARVALREFPAELVTAPTGREGLDAVLGAGDALPGVVLLDLYLPDMTGHDILRSMRADDRAAIIPVVVLSSSDDEADIAEAFRLGANSYVTKPADFRRFRETLQQVAAYWLGLNRTAHDGARAPA